MKGEWKLKDDDDNSERGGENIWTISFKLWRHSKRKIVVRLNNGEWRKTRNGMALIPTQLFDPHAFISLFCNVQFIIHIQLRTKAQKGTIFAKLMAAKLMAAISANECKWMQVRQNGVKSIWKVKLVDIWALKKVQLIAMDLVNTWEKAQNMTTTYFNDEFVHVSYAWSFHAIIMKSWNGSHDVTLTYFRLSCFVPFKSLFHHYILQLEESCNCNFLAIERHVSRTFQNVNKSSP